MARNKDDKTDAKQQADAERPMLGKGSVFENAQALFSDTNTYWGNPPK